MIKAAAGKLKTYDGVVFCFIASVIIGLIVAVLIIVSAILGLYLVKNKNHLPYLLRFHSFQNAIYPFLSNSSSGIFFFIQLL